MDCAGADRARPPTSNEEISQKEAKEAKGVWSLVSGLWPPPSGLRLSHHRVTQQWPDFRSFPNYSIDFRKGGGRNAIVVL